VRKKQVTNKVIDISTIIYSYLQVIDKFCLLFVFPDGNFEFFASPLQCGLVRGKPKVDMRAFDGTACIFSTRVTIPWDVEDGPIRITFGVDGGCTVTGFAPRGGDADLFIFAFIGAIGVNGHAKTEPATFPTATFATVAVAGDFDEFCRGADPSGRTDCVAAGAKEEETTHERKEKAKGEGWFHGRLLTRKRGCGGGKRQKGPVLIPYFIYYSM
jgi:hypothetical protein